MMNFIVRQKKRSILYHWDKFYQNSTCLNMPAGDEDDEEGAVARPGGGN